MARKNRDRTAEREAIRAAAMHLLTGTHFRSTAGKRTGTELITECGLRRDIVCGDHKDLMDEFKAQATAQNFTPQDAQRLAEENTTMRHVLAKAKGELAVERERVRALLRATAELSLELEQTREEPASAAGDAAGRLPHVTGHDRRTVFYRGGGTASSGSRT
ncbi:MULTISPECIES: hypothetical protein [Streptomyces]|uniref:hypothetical protein n=1 Tax=Streptomyces TaxID=1883 RepID=UPI000AD625AA|nr:MULTISPECIES: hypothetical protein [Streptomyces]MDX3608231.1 hypothetical protein [Streptomyces sp. FL06-04B]MDX3738615.1 hypothetical protein [Streptomyces sp. ID01-15D]